jgi:hypothetical protein
MTSHEHGIEQIRRLARQAERRIRLARALDAGVRALSATLLAAIAVVASRKLGLLSEGAARGALLAAAAGALGVLAAAWLWPLPERAGARALDRFHGLHDRLASALSFAALAERTAFMDAAVADAVEAAPSVRPRAAVPIPVPRGALPAAGLACVLAGVLLFEVRTHVPTAHAPTIEPVEMAADDLDDVKDFLKKVQASDLSDETKSAVEEFNKLVDDIANRRLDRTEAFRRMAALEDKLLTGSEADKKALEAELANIAEELKKSELLKPAGAALEHGNVEAARDALRDLARKAREHGGSIDKAKLEQMRAALKEAAGDAARHKEEVERRRQELADDILKRKEKAASQPPSDEERSLLEKKQRELERLDRDLGEKENAGRQLDRLDRDLAQAAEDLMKDLGAGADDLDRGAEDLDRMQRGDMSDKEKEELKQKLQELRELVRQQGSKGQAQRLRRFGRMARGQSGQGGQGGQQGGQQGEGQGDEGQGGGQGQNGQGQGGTQGQGQGGGTQAGQGGETWILGPDGQKMLVLSKGHGSGQGGQGGGQESGGQGGGPGRGTWGDGHDPNVQGKATNPAMGTEDTQVQGADSSQGGSRSQVILGAAERGFASRGYKRVYTEYHQVAEDSLAKDEVPGGYRFYVKRYFQLIRPREDK